MSVLKWLGAAMIPSQILIQVVNILAAVEKTYIY